MDLRQRLLSRLGLLLGSLLCMTLAVQYDSLRQDIHAEVAASNRLVDALVAASQGDQATLNSAAPQLRHLRVRLADSPAPASNADNPLYLLLGGTPETPERTIMIGSQSVLIAANPSSETAEQLADTVRLLITLLLYSGATLLVAWWVADRALRPVRDLESSLQRLADGHSDPALPAFALREFNRVARAIEGLAAALGEARAAQRALARQLISVQEDERHTLARELHDEMGQTLTALNVTASHMSRHAEQLDRAALHECTSELRRELRHCGKQLRDLLKTLRPHGLDATGLLATLRELLASWQIKGLGIEFAASLPENLPEVSESTALVVYRVMQEALTNVVRHSHASQCSVSLRCTEQQLCLCIEDNGCGLQQAGPARQGGLLGMAERVDMVGGQLRYDNRPEGGLRVFTSMPLQARQ